MRKGGIPSTAAGSDVRISKRHDAGGLFEDFGTTLQTDSQNKRNQTLKGSQPRGSKFTPSIAKTSYSQTVTRQGTNTGIGRTGSHSSRKTASPDTRSRSDTIELSDSQSDDEMDLLSQKSSLPDPSTFQRRPQDLHIPSMSSTSHGVRSTEKVFLDAQGKKHRYHEGFQPGNRLTGLKFNKIKEANQLAKAPQTSSQGCPPSPKSSSPLSNEDNFGGLMHSGQLQQPRMGDTVYVNHTGTQSRTTAHSKRANIPPFPTTTAGSPTATKNEPPRKSQPKPRPVGRIAHLRPQIKPTSSVTAVLDILTVGPSPSKSPSRSRSQCLSSKAMVRQPAAFPVPTPPASPVTWPKKITDFHISPLRESNLDDGRRSKPQASSSRLPEPFPVPSPPYNQRKEEMAGFRGTTSSKRSKENEDGGLFTEPEDDSPTTAASKSLKGKGKETERLTPAVKAKDGRPKKPKKFPMSTQMLESIGSSPDPGLRRGKRSPDRGSDDDERVKKKSKKEEDSYVAFSICFRVFLSFDSLLSETPLYRYAFEDEGDSGKWFYPFLSSIVDVVFPSLVFGPSKPLSVLRLTLAGTTISSSQPPPRSDKGESKTRSSTLKPARPKSSYGCLRQCLSATPL